MAESRNPFAKRNGRIITINDLSEDEKGLKCECECPICGGTFIARMGEIRTKHFAHSGEPCDVTKQLINSTYQLVAQSLLDSGYFYFPALYVFCDLTQIHFSYLESYKTSTYPRQNYEKIFDSGKWAVNTVEIINNSTGISVAIIVNKQLALRLSIDTEYCVEKDVSKYENMATLCIDIDDAIYRENTELLTKRIIAETDNKYWIFSPKLERWLENQEKERIDKYNKYLEHMRELEEQRRLEAEKRRKEEEERRSKEAERLEKLRKQREELLKAKQVRKPDEDYSKYIPKKKHNEYVVNMKWCAVCRKKVHPEDVMWGNKTHKYYCHKCIEEKGLNWKEL